MNSFETIQTLFSSIAPVYDRMNEAMSFGLHRMWKTHFVQHLPWKRLPSPFSYIDMACGSGDIAQRVLNIAAQHQHTVHATLCDPNTQMLQTAQDKLRDYPVQWVTSRGEETPFPDNSFDLYTIAFGLRNITHRLQALQEALRILKPGGFFYCLEFSRPTHPLIACAYRPYLRWGLPLWGALIAGKTAPYQYLADSIQAFPTQLQLEALLTTAGFKAVDHHNLSTGIVAIHWGQK